MSSLFQSVQFWVRRNLAWSNSRQSWQERIGVLVLLGGGGLLVGHSRGLELGQKLVLWLAWLVALAIVLRRGWLKLFGPVLPYDMVRVGRRSRYLLLRTLYIGGLFLLLAYVYWMWTLTWSRRQVFQVPSRELGKFAESFFSTFMATQFLVLLILTPAYVAGAVADEKNRKTLEFLLATDLRNREIVLGKLVSRLANLLLIVLAGLPILAFTQFFGGIDPDLLLAGFAAQAVTVFSMAGVSILFSVYSRRPRDAILFTYLTLFAYPALATGAYGVADGFGWTALGVPWPGWLGGGLLTLDDLLGWLNAGNPVYIYWVLLRLSTSGGALLDVAEELNRNYLAFHALVGLAASAWAVARLRAIALAETVARGERLELTRKLFRRPGVGDHGMIWKEVFVEAGWKLNWLGRIILGLLVGASFLPAAIILYNYADELLHFPNQVSRQDEFAWLMNVIQVRIGGTIVACLTLLGVTARAASSIGGERDRQTLDALLTTPLELNSILRAKWLGSVLGMRWGAAWLGGIWLVGMMTGGLHPLALPFLALAWLVYAGFFALVGLWFSIVSKTTGRATLWSLLTVLFIGGGHLCVGSTCCCAPFMMLGSLRGLEFVEAEQFYAFGLGQTPVAVLVAFAFKGDEFKGGPEQFFQLLFAFSLVGLACWSVAGLFLANLASVRFKQLTGRDEQNRPAGMERRPPPASARQSDDSLAKPGDGKPASEADDAWGQ